MSFDYRIRSLKEHHSRLQSEIDDESARPAPDDAQIADLKRAKLRIKDEIFRLQHAG